MTFAAMETMPKAEKEMILGQQKRSKQSEFYEYELEAANQRLQEKEASLQATNQRLQEKEASLQAAITKIKSQIPQIIPLYERRIANWERLSQSDRKALEFARNI